MAKSGMYVGLDIGTASVKVVVAEYVEGQMNIIGVGDAKSEGLDRGIVVDIEETVSSIQKAVKQAEMKSGIEINRKMLAEMGIHDPEGFTQLVEVSKNA